jgi:riboflavin kinase/FMN adenylyltransferase
MKCRRDLLLLRRIQRPVVLAAGFFDGVHLGHQSVLNEAIRRARARRGEAWVLTFDRHPLKVLRPAEAPRLLTSNEHRLLLFKRLGLDGCFMLPFTPVLAATEADVFIDQLLSCTPPLTEVLVGANWRFGHLGRGTPGRLASRGKSAGLRVKIIHPVLLDNVPISSTRIRKAVLKGRLAEVEQMLGRRFSVLGTVTRGRGIGTTLGFPTANLEIASEVLPPYGVYAVRVRHGRQHFDAVMNYGVRPTFNADPSEPAIIELHLFNFDGCLYGQDLEVFFHKRLRPERRFPTIPDLQRQMHRDAQQARRIMEAAPL